MPEYAVHVRTDFTGDLSEDLVEFLLDALGAFHAAPGADDGRLSVQMTVEADGMLDAHADATNSFLAAMKDFGASVSLVGVEVLTEDEFERFLRGPSARVDDLVSTAEAANFLGVSRQRVLALAKSASGFPEAVRLGARGKHWSQTALARFAATWDRSPGPTPKAKHEPESKKPASARRVRVRPASTGKGWTVVTTTKGDAIAHGDGGAGRTGSA